jgi:hypothetical protein
MLSVEIFQVLDSRDFANCRNSMAADDDDDTDAFALDFFAWDSFSTRLDCIDALPAASAPFASRDVLAAARDLGTSAATIVSGNGKTRQGIGAIDVDWSKSVAKLLATPDPAERIEHLRAHGLLAQVKALGDAMREAGVVDAAVTLLLDEDDMVSVAAADVIRHCTCANQGSRIRAREAGAIPHLVRMLTRVADAECPAERAASVVTAAVAALRNLSFQNGANRDLIRDSGGLEPLLRIVASGPRVAGQPPAPPAASDFKRREAAYRAAGALENLAADNEENAAAIVDAGVVPAMRELLIGVGRTALSNKVLAECH